MKLNVKANENVTCFDKLKYIVCDNKEKFTISSTALDIEEDIGKTNELGSLFLTLLNLKDDDFQNLEDYIEPLRSIIPLERKPYNIENAILYKTKIYIENIISNNYDKKYEIFKITCELGYFKVVIPYEQHDLKKISEKINVGIKKYSSENLNYIYKYYKEKKIKTFTTYEITEFEDFIVATLSEIFKRGKTIKKCKNCGKYFIPKRSDAQYCDNPSPQNPEKTCKEYAPSDALIQNKIFQLYRKIYKSLNGKKGYYCDDKALYKEHEENYTKFIRENNEQKKQIKCGKRTSEEYTQWLTEQAEKYNIEL